MCFKSKHYNDNEASYGPRAKIDKPLNSKPKKKKRRHSGHGDHGDAGDAGG
jgi:hypothetical protein